MAYVAIPKRNAGDAILYTDQNQMVDNFAVLALRLIKTQTIGSAVASVTVSGAFSADYDNYLLTVTNVDCAADNAGFYLRLGSSTTRNDYFLGGQNINIGSGTVAYDRSNGGNAGILIGYTTVNETNVAAEIMAPFLAQPSTGLCVWSSDKYSGYAATHDQSAVSYADFQIHTPTTTMTGGEIRVYGYINS